MTRPSIDRRAAFWYGIMHDRAHILAHNHSVRNVPHSHPDLFRWYPDGYPDSDAAEAAVHLRRTEVAG